MLIGVLQMRTVGRIYGNWGMAMPADFAEAEIPADSIRNVTLEQARWQDIGFTLWFKAVELC